MAEKHVWNKQRVAEVALLYNTRSQFQYHSSGAYQYARRIGCLDEVCKHMKKSKRGGSKGVWNHQNVAQEAKKYDSRLEFQQSAVGAYSYARINDILDDVCAHMDHRKTKPVGFWTEERLAEEAKKYQSRKEFYEQSLSAYSTAIKLGILDAICAHMPMNKKPNNFWTKDRIKAAYARTTSVKEFRKKYSGAYGAARNHGWWYEIRFGKKGAA